FLAGLMIEKSPCLHAELIVPIPLSPKRLRSRGFHQSYQLARPLGKKWKIPVDPFLLVRREGEKSQIGLTRAERFQNVKGAFSIPEKLKKKVVGRALLLVDDVYTTGATMTEAARTLQKEGATVSFLTLARRR
ncbi:MAG: phosphoribosyltransferase family protein, partial [bacterium]|nr:phosphoribosyltransferase family protein [bacterium]